MVMPAVEEEDTLEQAASKQSVADEQDGGKVLDKDALGDSLGCLSVQPRDVWRRAGQLGDLHRVLR